VPSGKGDCWRWATDGLKRPGLEVGVLPAVFKARSMVEEWHSESRHVWREGIRKQFRGGRNGELQTVSEEGTSGGKISWSGQYWMGRVDGGRVDEGGGRLDGDGR
jgi:hypothetical protein